MLMETPWTPFDPTTGWADTTGARFVGVTASMNLGGRGPWKSVDPQTRPYATDATDATDTTDATEPDQLETSFIPPKQLNLEHRGNPKTGILRWFSCRNGVFFWFLKLGIPKSPRIAILSHGHPWWLDDLRNLHIMPYFQLPSCKNRGYSKSKDPAESESVQVRWLGKPWALDMNLLCFV